MIETPQYQLEELTDVKNSFFKVWEHVPYVFDVHVKLLHKIRDSSTNLAIPESVRNYPVGLYPLYNKPFKGDTLKLDLKALLESLYEAVQADKGAVMKVIVYFLAQREEDGQNKLKLLDSSEPINFLLQRIAIHYGWPSNDVASLRLWVLGFLILPRLAKIAKEEEQLDFFSQLVQGSPFAQSYDPLLYTLDESCEWHDKAVVPVKVQQLGNVFETEFLLEQGVEDYC
ncbi:hypothetical protein IWQ61_010748 [Dispira simplex]|nr:hypothetical protein IWQ61_010748 [Dispira simplex]